MSYDFLNTITIPRHMAIAKSFLGLKEIPGASSNATILQWSKELGLDSIYKNDDTSWCALFVAYTMFKASRRIMLPTNEKWDYLRALQYQYATNLIKVPIAEAAFGDIMIFQRPGGGHIAYYTSEDLNTYHILGGNQGNKVSVIRIEKHRLVTVRRPEYISYKPEKIFVSATGTISTNEA